MVAFVCIRKGGVYIFYSCKAIGRFVISLRCQVNIGDLTNYGSFWHLNWKKYDSGAGYHASKNCCTGSADNNNACMTTLTEIGTGEITYTGAPK